MIIDTHKRFLEEYHKKYGDQQYNFLKAVCKNQIPQNKIDKWGKIDNSKIKRWFYLFFKI